LPDPFTDNPAGSVYADAVIWAANNGIVSGYGNGSFGSDDDINREQMTVLLVNYLNYKGIDLPAGQAVSFDDESHISSWALDSIKMLQAAGIVSGKPGNIYDPIGAATRAEIATIIVRLMEILDVFGF